MQQSPYHASGERSAQAWGGPFPNLHMWPLHDTFSMKMIYLPDSQRIKIGRQTNNKTTPGERNAFFDSKVLSRLHAEVWEQGGKIYIKDIKSSNGTFINNERLSPEGVESDPYELKSEDLVEFGIDIVSDDNRTIVHHKVAAKVFCCFTAEDAALSASQHRRSLPNAAPNPNPTAAPAVMSSGGKVNGLSFDHVLLKLQTELAKSKETGAELQELTGNMGEIVETLGGGLAPSQNGSAGHLIPPQYRSNSAEAKAALAGPHGQQAAAFISLQNQLSDTQTSLNTHIDRIRGLENGLSQGDLLKAEVASLRSQMEESRREMDLIVSGSRGRTNSRRMNDDQDGDDDDDTRSVITIMDNEDAEERMRSKRKMDGGSERNGESGVSASTPDKTIKEIVAQNDELASRVQTLSDELSGNIRTSQQLQTQHDQTLAAVRTLTEWIGSLEQSIASRIAEAVSESDKKWEVWRTHAEEGWKKEQASWEAERERLRGVVRDWEQASRRANEEEEDRELNERLSGEDMSDEEKRPDVKTNGLVNGRLSRRTRRRRPSNKTTLAIRGLRELVDEGSSTPKLPPGQISVPQSVGDAAAADRSASPDRDSSDGSASVHSDQSTQSGKESVDTLQGRDEARRRGPRSKADAPVQHAVPIFTVVVVAIIAGAWYYRHTD